MIRKRYECTESIYLKAQRLFSWKDIPHRLYSRKLNYENIGLPTLTCVIQTNSTSYIRGGSITSEQIRANECRGSKSIYLSAFIGTPGNTRLTRGRENFGNILNIFLVNKNAQLRIL